MKDKIKLLKWTATALTLTGILTFYLDFYPYSMIPHSLGILCWTAAGIITKDKPLLANFSLQIPIILAGIIKLLFSSSWWLIKNLYFLRFEMASYERNCTTQINSTKIVHRKTWVFITCTFFYITNW